MSYIYSFKRYILPSILHFFICSFDFLAFDLVKPELEPNYLFHYRVFDVSAKMATQTRHGEPELPKDEESEGCRNANLPANSFCRAAGKFTCSTTRYLHVYSRL